MSKLKVNKKVNLIVNKNLKQNKIFKNKINLINVNYSPKKPFETSTWKIKKASFMLLIVPNKVLLRSSIRFPNSPPVPNALDKPCIDSLVFIETPSLKPAIALTPLSLKSSALDIPALNDL